jgi:hypothetical protein
MSELVKLGVHQISYLINCSLKKGGFQREREKERETETEKRERQRQRRERDRDREERETEREGKSVCLSERERVFVRENVC